MVNFIIHRIITLIPVLFVVSIISFIIIQLPPGDYLTSYIANLSATGEKVEMEIVEALRKQYALDRPIYIQYFKWLWRILHGDLGYSFEWNKPVNDLIWNRLGMTLALSAFTLLFTWAVAVPIGIYSATHQYSAGDYFFTFIGFIGLATPSFLLALVIMWVGFAYLGLSVGGLFSSEYASAPWSLGKFVDLLKHVWIPMVIVGTSGTASLIRIVRGNLLDELKKQYVITARAKGASEVILLFKYPVRVAINPLVSTVGWTLPELFSGIVIVAVVLSLPTEGPMLLQALLTQDMYLAGSFVMILALLTVIGTLISDLLLAWIDPRIRFGGREG